MKKIIFLLLQIFLTPTVKGDIGIRDIFQVNLNGEYYYFELGSRGVLKESDLCYYGSQESNSYIGEVDIIVKEILLSYLKKGHAPTLYKDLHKVRMQKFKKYVREDYLFLLKGELRALKNENEINALTFEDAFPGNTVGYIYTKNLNKADNNWISENEIEELFQKNYGECMIGVFSIKGVLTKEEKEILSKEFDNISTSQDEQYLAEIYKKKIIKIGNCFG